MLLASERRLRAWQERHTVFREAPPEAGLEQLRSAHWTATYAADPQQSRAHYLLLADSARQFLHHRQTQAHPLVIAEACILLHDVQSVLNRPADALYYAKFAGAVLSYQDSANFPDERERFDHLSANAVYAETVTLTSLRRFRQAALKLDEMELIVKEHQTAAAFWTPHIKRSRLAAISGLPRFRRRGLEDLWHDARKQCDQQSGPLSPQMAMLIDLALARAYVQFGSGMSLHKADRLLRPHVEALDRIPELGPLRRVVILKTFAHISRARGDTDEWRHIFNQARSVAEAGGLAHQLQALQREMTDSTNRDSPA